MICIIPMWHFLWYYDLRHSNVAFLRVLWYASFKCGISYGFMICVIQSGISYGFMICAIQMWHFLWFYDLHHSNVAFLMVLWCASFKYGISDGFMMSVIQMWHFLGFYDLNQSNVAFLRVLWSASFKVAFLRVLWSASFKCGI